MNETAACYSYFVSSTGAFYEAQPYLLVAIGVVKQVVYTATLGSFLSWMIRRFRGRRKVDISTIDWTSLAGEVFDVKYLANMWRARSAVNEIDYFVSEDEARFVFAANYLQICIVDQSIMPLESPRTTSRNDAELQRSNSQLELETTPPFVAVDFSLVADVIHIKKQHERIGRQKGCDAVELRMMLLDEFDTLLGFYEEDRAILARARQFASSINEHLSRHYKEKVAFADSRDSLFAKLLISNKYMVLAHTLYFIAFCIMAAVTACQGSDDHWQRYQMMYFSVMNSSVVIAASKLNTGQKAFVEGDTFMTLAMIQGCSSGRYQRFAVNTISAIMIPCVMTHCLPAIVMYCWVVLLPPLAILGVFSIFMAMCKSDRQGAAVGLIGSGRRKSKQEIRVNELEHVGIYLVTMIATVTVLQTSYNYAVLVYRQPSPISGDAYINIISQEFHSRSLQCFWDTLRKHAINTVQVISSIIPL